MNKNLYIPPESDILIIEQESCFLDVSRNGNGSGQNLDSPYDYNPY